VKGEALEGETALLFLVLFFLFNKNLFFSSLYNSWFLTIHHKLVVFGAKVAFYIYFYFHVLSMYLFCLILRKSYSPYGCTFSSISIVVSFHLLCTVLGNFLLISIKGKRKNRVNPLCILNT